MSLIISLVQKQNLQKYFPRGELSPKTKQFVNEKNEKNVFL